MKIPKTPEEAISLLRWYTEIQCERINYFYKMRDTPEEVFPSLNKTVLKNLANGNLEAILSHAVLEKSKALSSDDELLARRDEVVRSNIIKD